MKKVQNCKSCGAGIIWLRTLSGKSMPVDYLSVSDGETVFDYSKHTSHFATCKNADQHRRRK